MAKFDKCLCNVKKKEIVDNMKKFTAIVDKPEFVCCNCSRVANKKKNLCNPKKLKKDSGEVSA